MQSLTPQRYLLVLLCFGLTPLFPKAAFPAHCSFAPFFVGDTAPKKLSRADILGLLRGGVPSNRVRTLAQKYGIDFEMDAQIESDLREAGARDDLIVVLRNIAPKLGPPVVHIHVLPSGARVYIDDESVGTTSLDGDLKISTLSVGQHRIRISLDGYRDAYRTVAISPGQVVEVSLTLEEQPAIKPPVLSPATLIIQTLPPGVRVYVDDEPIGTTNSDGRLKISTLPQGVHRLRLSLDGYQDDYQNVELSSGRVTDVNSTLIVFKPPRLTPDVKPAVEETQPVIYFCRLKQSRHGHPTQTLAVFCDDRIIGQLREGDYVNTTLAPGKHVCRSTDEKSQLNMNLETGKVYYVQLSFSVWTLSPNPAGHLKLVSSGPLQSGSPSADQCLKH